MQCGCYVGWIAFLGYLPTLITGPLFGVLVDRVPVRRAAMQSQGALFCLYLMTAVLFSAGALTLVVLPVIALGLGVVASAHHPVRMSLAPLLVPKGDIPSLVTALALNFNLARTFGPALGGILIAQAGIATALWVVVGFAVPYLASLPYLHPREREMQSEARSTSLVEGFAEGIRHAVRTPFIRQILLTTLLYAFLARGMVEVLPLVADGVFARGAAGLGALTAALGLGALAAAALLTIAPPPQAGVLPPRGQIAALTAVGMAVLLAISASWPMALAAAAALGACSTLLGVSMQSALQPALPDDFRGRVMSFWVMTAIGSAAFGALVIGALTDLVGLRPAVIGLGVCIAVLLLLLPRWDRRFQASRPSR